MMSQNTPSPRTRRPVRWVAGIVFILAVFASGYYLAQTRTGKHPQTGPEISTPKQSVAADHSAKAAADSPAKTAVRHTMSEAAKRLAEVQTVEVKRGKAYLKLRMNGMVFHDETRLVSLTSRVDGRIDKVLVDFTGLAVNKDDPVVTIWSRTLITTQIELFETIRSPEYGESVVKGAEEKLKQFGLTDQQIEEIRRENKPDLYITLRSPINGIVMMKNVNLGDFVKEGTVMYEIADLSKVWVKLDAYETDLPWIRYGQEVTFTTPAIPGRKFKGQVVFIDPVLDMATRSVKVRVEADNPDLALKPHMFVTAEVEAEVDDQGRVIRSEWAGKYICPLYPKEVYSEPGICPSSNMPLRPAAAFGYAPEESPTLPLVITAGAVLYTGKRSIVYVEVPNQGIPTYELREVALGPRAGDRFVIYEGLEEGEQVVAEGNFEIDSAAQIVGSKSMMNPEGGRAVTGHAGHSVDGSKPKGSSPVNRKLDSGQGSEVRDHKATKDSRSKTESADHQTHQGTQ
ncbi:efflux RND transporter periplasmic adaptor subunit [Thermodesulfobacteriota bacterium]